MFILKQDVGEDHLPIVNIGSYGFEHPVLDIQLILKQLPTPAQLDALRYVLKTWAMKCGFGELAEGAE